MNSIGLYNALASTNLTPKTQEERIQGLERVDSINDVSQEKTSKPGAGESLILSSHSQKLHAISDEFFSNQDFSQTDAQRLINQSYDYGLISDDEFEQLANNASFSSNSSVNLESNSLIDQLNTLKGMMTTEDKEQGLLKGVSDAISVLSDVESQKLSPTFKRDINHSITQLNSFTNSEAFETLESEAQSSIQSSVAALSLIDKISPQRMANPQVNRYLDFSQ